MSNEPKGGLTAALAVYLSECRCESLPPPVVVRAKQMVLDTLGAMLVGSTLPPGRTIARYVVACGGRPEATLAGTALLTDCATAALANAISAHADEVDDSHFASLTHPAAATVPVALALGEARGLDGARMIAAVAAGYDVQCRVSLALDPRRLQRRGFMPLAICGHFGAVASASVMLGLPAERIVDALGLAGLQAAGLWASAMDPSHMARALMAGAPARSGLMSALLAEQGFEGPPAVLEGRDGVLQSFSDDPEPGELTRELGERYEILLTSIKKHACGGPIRGPVDGLLAIMRERRLAARDLRTIRVRLARSACQIVDGRDDPTICLQHVMAVAAVDGRVDVEQTHSPERIQAPEVRELKRRVELVPDDEMEKVWPAHRPAVTEVETRSGERFSMRVEHAAGSPGNPMAQAEVEAKFERLAAAAAGPEAIRQIVEMARDLEGLGDLRQLGELLRSGGQGT